MTLTIDAALDLRPPALVAFVGGGGKTSLMFALAQTLGEPVVVTTTTRIFAAQMKLAPAVCYPDTLDELQANLQRHGLCLVVGKVEGDKAMGVDPNLPARLLARSDVAYVLVEADGSRMRPVKAPAAHEPVVPAQTTLLVPVVGLDALERPIREVAHRPELVRRLLAERLPEVTDEHRLAADDIAAIITHPEGGLKNVPGSTRIVPFINKVESESDLISARRIASLTLRNPRIDRVILGAVRTDRPIREVHKRVTALVLAAGQSRRMGQMKLALPWNDTSVLGQTLRHLKLSSVHDILVVTGHEASAIGDIAQVEGVPAIHNPDYANGEMLSSLQAAVRSLKPRVSAVLVMLADQPMVEPWIVDRILEAYWRGEGELVAPAYKGQRGNPVLIGRTYFDELLGLPAGSAPRVLLGRHPDEICHVAVDSDAILRDLDRPEEYLRWRPQGQ